VEHNHILTGRYLTFKKIPPALATKPDALVKIGSSMRARMVSSLLYNRDEFAKNIDC